MTERFTPAIVVDDLRRIRYPARAEPKLNGVRLLALVDRHGKVTLRSRSGREYSLPRIAAAVGALGLRNMVLDGELDGSSGSGPGRRAGFETALSALQGNATALAACRYAVWDLVKRGGQGAAWTVRRKALEHLACRFPRGGPLEILGGRTVADEGEMRAFFEEVTRAGGEGIVLKDPAADYHADDWVRLKAEATFDGIVTGAVEGKNRLRGKLGALVVEFDGIETRVGIGFTACARAALWRGRRFLVGGWLEARADRKTSAGKLCFPRFVRFREDKTWSSGSGPGRRPGKTA